MSLTIWKYPVVVGAFTRRMPKGSTFLSCQWQGNAIQMWWCVDTATEEQEKRFVVHGTGHHIPVAPALRFLATFQVDGGSLIFHLFEEI